MGERMPKIEENFGYCPNCKKGVVVKRPGPNHIVHLLLSLLTGGMWVVIWLLCCLFPGKWKCAECLTGAKVN
jgi:hypothetical protein